ncbi:MAG: hypothetical protein RR406_00055 [Bacilli bacterium]
MVGIGPDYMYDLNQEGIVVIANEEKKRILINVGKDCTGTARQKISAIDSVINNTGTYQRALPEKMVVDIKLRESTVADNIYMFTLNEYSVSEIVDISTSRKSKDLRRAIKLYIRRYIFKDYEFYKDEILLSKYKKKIIELFSKEYIYIYKSVDNDYTIAKRFNTVKIKVKDIVSDNKSKSASNINTDKVEVKVETKISNNIDELIDIECMLRNVSKEELISSLISDKAKEIQRYINNKIII